MSRHIFLLGFLIWMTSCATTQAKSSPPVFQHDLVMQELTDFEGQPFKPENQKPRIQILEFWASWCAPCREAMPHMDRLYRQYKTKGLDVIAISVDEDPTAALNFVAQVRPRFSVAWDPYGEAQSAYGVGTLPTTVILDENGQPIMRLAGYTPENHKMVRHQVELLLQP